MSTIELEQLLKRTGYRVTVHLAKDALFEAQVLREVLPVLLAGSPISVEVDSESDPPTLTFYRTDKERKPSDV